MSRDSEFDTAPIVVVGNGMAGVRLLQYLREDDERRPAIICIGAEPMEAYDRLKLSALLSGEAEYRDSTLVSRRWYDQQDIDLQIGVRVTAIDRRRKRVRLSSGHRIPYSKLVLATGSVPARLRIAGVELAGVKTFHDLADMRDMRALATAGRRAVVIGGGLGGLEAAHGLAGLGMQVTVVQLMDRMMERQLDPSASYFLLRAFLHRKIDVLLNTETQRLIGKSRVEAVEFRDGSRIEADLVVMAVGARPNITLAKSAGLAVDRGVTVDDFMCSSDPDIHAVGECAEHRGQLYGLVAPLYEQAEVCARVLLRRPVAPYGGSVAAASMKVGGIDVFSAGDFVGLPGTEEVTSADPDRPFYRKLVIRPGPDGATRLVGAVLIGETRDAARYLQFIRAGAPIDDIRRTMDFASDQAELASATAGF